MLSKEFPQLIDGTVYYAYSDAEITRMNENALVRILLVLAFNNLGTLCAKFAKFVKEIFGSYEYLHVCVKKDGSSPIICIGSEDLEYDYDPPHFNKIRRDAYRFKNETGLEVEELGRDEEYGLFRDHGPHHVVRIEKILAEIERELPDSAKKHLYDARKECRAMKEKKERERIERQTREREDKVQKIATEILKSVQLSEGSVRFVAEFVEKNKICLGKNAVAVAGDWVVVAVGGYDTVTTYSKVTDHTNRQVYALNMANYLILMSGKERDLFRTTDTGVLRQAFKTAIEGVKVEDGVITVEFPDGKISIDVSTAKQPWVVSYDTQEKIQALIDEEIDRLRKQKDLKIRVCSPGTGGRIIEREPRIWASRVLYTGPESGTVQIAEEIDFRPGHAENCYAVQSRINLYQVGPGGITLISSKTTGYE